MVGVRKDEDIVRTIQKCIEVQCSELRATVISVYEGDPLVIMGDPLKNADLTQELEYAMCA